MGEIAAALAQPPLARSQSRALRTINIALVAGTLATVVAWNQSLVHWRENVLDSYLFGYYGWRIAHGARPYLDVWDNKPPGIWWANALAFQVFGEGPQVDWAVGSAALFLTLAAFVGIARAAWHPSLIWPAAIVAALLLTNVTYECGANRTETLVIACETAGVCCYGRWLRTRRTAWLIAAGVMLGAAPWCKQAGLGASFGVVFHILWTFGRAGGRSLTWLALGAAVPSIAAVSLLASQGALDAAHFAILDFNRLYFEAGDASWWQLSRPLEVYAAYLLPLAPLAVLAVVGTLFARRFGRRRESNAEVADFNAVLWIWLLVTFYLVCVGVGRLAYHLMPLLPPLGLLLLQPLGRIAAAQGLAHTVIRHPSVGALLVLTIAAALHVSAAGWPDARQCLARRPPAAGWLPATPPQYARQAAEIQKWCPTGGTLYVWGWSPGTYRFSYRANTCRFGTLEKMGHLGLRALFVIDEVVHTLRRNPPAVMAISARDFEGICSDSDDPLGQWMLQTYDDAGDIDGMHILHRRN